MPRGRALATAGDDGELKVWDTATGELMGTYTAGPGGEAWSPSFSPDGTLVAGEWLEPETGVVRVFDRVTGELVSEFERQFVTETDFSPDSTRLLLASPDQPGMVVIDPRTGEKLLDLGGDDVGAARTAQYSPDGRWIASGHFDGLVRFWDAQTGALRFAVAGHSSEVNSVDWSADSTRLASAANDGTARVLEVTDEGARPLASVSARDTGNGLAAVAFSPDADRILTGDWAVSSAKIWDVSDRSGAEWLHASSPVFRFAADGFLPDSRTVRPDRSGWWGRRVGRADRRAGAPPGPDRPGRRGVRRRPESRR